MASIFEEPVLWIIFLIGLALLVLFIGGLFNYNTCRKSGGQELVGGLVKQRECRIGVSICQFWVGGIEKHIIDQIYLFLLGKISARPLQVVCTLIPF